MILYFHSELYVQFGLYLHLNNIKCGAFLEEIIVRLILLVSELSKFPYPKFSLAADCPLLEVPAINPILGEPICFLIISIYYIFCLNNSENHYITNLKF